MELQQAMETRRSVREYLPRPVEPEKIAAVLQAASLAPSWKNSQVARYYVAASPQAVEDVRAALPAFTRDSCKNAPVLVVCAMVSHRSGFERSGEATNELGDGWGCYDCGLAHMNLLLKATELGLSTLVMGIRDADALRRRLEIPDPQTVLGVIAIGYSDLAPDMPPRRSPEETIRYF